MKWFKSVYRTGLFVLVPFVLIISIVLWFWNTVVGLSFGHPFVALCVLAAGPLVVGWLVSKRWLRHLVLWLCSHIPIVSNLTGFFLNHDFIERMKSGDFNRMPAVKFQLWNGAWTTGIVTGSYEGPMGFPNGPIVKWLVVIIPTSPMALTGPVVEIVDSPELYTGESGMDVILQVASFGTNWKTGKGK